MKFCILMGSPRKNGNTMSLLKPFVETIEAGGHESDIIHLYNKKIEPCLACRRCQEDFTKFGCVQNDDMQEIFDKVLGADVVIWATPIYSWYCTAPMKAVLDRLVYGMNKYYGEEKGPALWAGKKHALLITCGYPPEKGADLFEQGMIRYFKHSRLLYLGALKVHDEGYNFDFMTDEKADATRAFAQTLLGARG